MRAQWRWPFQPSRASMAARLKTSSAVCSSSLPTITMPNGSLPVIEPPPSVRTPAFARASRRGTDAFYINDNSHAATLGTLSGLSLAGQRYRVVPCRRSGVARAFFGLPATSPAYSNRPSELFADDLPGISVVAKRTNLGCLSRSVGVHSRNSIDAASRGFSHRQCSVFSAAKPSPHRLRGFLE
jgi:hypothetical protein